MIAAPSGESPRSVKSTFVPWAISSLIRPVSPPAAAVIIAILAGSRTPTNVAQLMATDAQMSSEQPGQILNRRNTMPIWLALAWANKQRFVLPGIILQLLRKLHSTRRDFQMTRVTLGFKPGLCRFASPLDEN